MATALVLVIDAVGITTFNYLLDRYPGEVHFSNLSRLGLGDLLDERHRGRFGSADGRSCATHIDQASASADSVVGHREMMGIVDLRTYNLFPDGFPPEYISALEVRVGRRIMFNQMVGGMEAIELNAEEHARTGCPIAYASKCDPLLQLAVDEAVIPVPEQRRIADIALTLALEMGISITRVIDRAFIRTAEGEYTRTANRYDAVLPLPGRTLVDILRERGIWTVAVGKPSDLVKTTYDSEYHLTDLRDLDGTLNLRFIHPKKKDTNPFTTQGVMNALAEVHRGRSVDTFIFANWVDTDALFGHTRDVAGALHSIEECDRVLPVIEAQLQTGDLLIITADHGMEHRADYGYHNREPVPFLAKRIGYGADLDGLEFGQSPGLTQVGDIVAQMFGYADEFRRSIIKIPA